MPTSRPRRQGPPSRDDERQSDRDERDERRDRRAEDDQEDDRREPRSAAPSSGDLGGAFLKILADRRCRSTRPCCRRVCPWIRSLGASFDRILGNRVVIGAGEADDEHLGRAVLAAELGCGAPASRKRTGPEFEPVLAAQARKLGSLGLSTARGPDPSCRLPWNRPESRSTWSSFRD